MNKGKPPVEYNLRRAPNRRPKWDNALLGLIIGIIFPCIGLLLLYFLWSSSYWNFPQYLKQFVNLDSSRSMKAASKLISLSIILNLIPFYFFSGKKAMQTVKGIVIASALALLLVVLYLFVWQ